MNSTNRNITIANFVRLIIFVGLIRARFTYYPQSAINTMKNLHNRAAIQLGEWMGDPNVMVYETNSNTNAPDQDNNTNLIITNEDQASTDTITNGDTTDTIDGDTSDIDEAENIMISSDIETFTQSTSTSGERVEGTGSILGSGSQIIQTIPSTNQALNITIGNKVIIVEGNPQEDIIIDGGSYRVIIQSAR